MNGMNGEQNPPISGTLQDLSAKSFCQPIWLFTSSQEMGFELRNALMLTPRPYLGLSFETFADREKGSVLC